MAIKVGELAVLKSSKEDVFVLAINKFDKENSQGGAKIANAQGLTGDTVLVRRPTLTEGKGVAHLVEEFLLEELETHEDAMKRDVADREQLRSMFFGGKTDEEDEQLALPDIKGLN